MTASQTNSPMKDGFPKLARSSEIMTNSKIPKLGVSVFLEAQSKNVEAATAINQAIFDNFQSYATRQAELMYQSIEEISQLMNAIIAAPEAREKLALQSEGSKMMIERFMENACDTAETIGKCNSNVMETFSNRVSDGMKEFSGMMKADLAA